MILMFCHWTILDTMIIYISSMQNELEIKDITDSQMSACYIDLHREIEKEEI